MWWKPEALAALIALVAAAALSAQAADEAEELLRRLEARVQALEKTSSAYKQVIESLARQVSMQQFYVEETTRSTGDSGLKRTRLAYSGPRPYHGTSYSDYSSVAAIHDHANYQRTIGMGELVVVLNGVEFRTRHNDYKLTMPSTRSLIYGQTEPVPLPQVPLEVLAKPTVEEQSLEMREWFKAWRDRDHTKRDYRKYFKPVLCYMEGMWTEADSKSGINEPYDSERHKLDASTFFDLQNKARYSSATGRKSIAENYAFLPTTISEVGEDGLPRYSQWNYKILCHPLKQDIPQYRFKQEDDLGPRVTKIKSFDESFLERYQRFSLWPNQPFNEKYRSTRETVTSKLTGSFLDDLMAEIPGKDNYPGDIKDYVFNNMALNYRHGTPSTPQNVAYYRRLYKMSRKDAMGSDITFRSFSDANLYVAFNSRPQITPVKAESCRPNYGCKNGKDSNNKDCSPTICQTWVHRVSYAIPLEIIYLTPLLTWNPYNLAISNSVNVPKKGNTDGKYERTGANTAEMALYGISTNYYFYQTPLSFFGGPGYKVNPADTVYGAISVLDKQGNIRRTMASGTYILTPNIEGVGVLRLRYPIMPLHQSGNAVFKELEALKDVTLSQARFSKFYRDRTISANGTVDEVFTFEVGQGDGGEYGPHYHTVELTTSDLRALKAGEFLTTLTSSDIGHSHEIVLRFRGGPNDGIFGYLELMECDGRPWICDHGHTGRVICNECMTNSAFPHVN